MCFGIADVPDTDVVTVVTIVSRVFTVVVVAYLALSIAATSAIAAVSVFSFRWSYGRHICYIECLVSFSAQLAGGGTHLNISQLHIYDIFPFFPLLHIGGWHSKSIRFDMSSRFP